MFGFNENNCGVCGQPRTGLGLGGCFCPPATAPATTAEPCEVQLPVLSPEEILEARYVETLNRLAQERAADRRESARLALRLTQLEAERERLSAVLKETNRRCDRNTSDFTHARAYQCDACPRTYPINGSGSSTRPCVCGGHCTAIMLYEWPLWMKEGSS